MVEVPSPYSGKVVKLFGGAGAVIETGAPLVQIEIDPALPQRAEARDTGHHHGPPGRGRDARACVKSEAARRARRPARWWGR